jgi:hypothetical protein
MVDAGERPQVEGSDRRWRGAIAGGGRRQRFRVNEQDTGDRGSERGMDH